MASLLVDAPAPAGRRDLPRLHSAGPTLVVAVNALLFWLIKPGVPDLWAARARASAAGDGVGVTYWFGWFGGSSPGGYSVISPYVNAALGTELVVALAAVAVSAATAVLLDGSRRAAAAGWVAAFGVCVNLWCGRAPFLLGAAIGVAALLLVRRRRVVAAPVAAALSVLASPVVGAFLALALTGSVLGGAHRGHRSVAVVTGAGAVGTLLTLGALFGSSGPEPMPAYVVVELLGVLAVSLLARPARPVRAILAITAVVVLVMAVVPNALGSNIGRFVLFCLPVAVVASSTRGRRAVVALMAPVLVLDALDPVTALISSTEPGASTAYYAPLVTELDRLHATTHRLEVANGAHAAYAVLLGHAVLARGWETQEDAARNGVLQDPSLTALRYRRWLADNAVGLVAMVATGNVTPEARVVRAGHAGYLREVWRSSTWRLYEVRDATPIVAAPAVLSASSQSSMTVRVPCACRTTVRIRWSRFLDVDPVVAAHESDAAQDEVHAAIAQDSSGWTELITNTAGTYTLSGE